MKSFEILLSIVITFTFYSVVYAKSFDYDLKPIKVAKDTYVFVGKTDDFSFANGGNIVNTSFIVSSKGVIVIDTGPSLRYGQQMKQAIANVTNKKIIAVYLTHHHPDHFLGNQAFSDVPIYALAGTVSNIQNEGAAFADNLYLMVGDWMRGTDVYLPSHKVKQGIYSVGEHRLELLAYEGHTSSDMAIFDHSTGVLFAGDLVFHKRTLTTPHANLKQWQAAITKLSDLPFKVLVPGHGGISHDKKPLQAVSDYLTWLDAALSAAANDGLSMMETMAIKLPERFKSNSLLHEEFSRSVIHLYQGYENDTFKAVN